MYYLSNFVLFVPFSTVMTFSKDAARCKADRSLFERLHEIGWPVHLLRYQYRMHDEIARFPSKTFYDDLLITSESVKRRGPALWHQHNLFPPYRFWNVERGVMNKAYTGGFSNQKEAIFVYTLLRSFQQTMRCVRNISIGVISFYNVQVSKINNILQQDQKFTQWLRAGNMNIQVSTVDGFQGAEKDIIILSCVRSQWHGQNARNQVGFLKDFRRVNVALTRAKHSLWIVGDASVLSTDELWKSLIDDVSSRNLMAAPHLLHVHAHAQRQIAQSRRGNKQSRRRRR